MVQETTSGPGDRTGSANPTWSKVKKSFSGATRARSRAARPSARVDRWRLSATAAVDGWSPPRQRCRGTEPGLQASPSALTPTDVAAFLGRPVDPSTPDEVTAHLETVTAMVRADTRGRGLSTAGEPADDLAGVILTATVRMLANPEQVE